MSEQTGNERTPARTPDFEPAQTFTPSTEQAREAQRQQERLAQAHRQLDTLRSRSKQLEAQLQSAGRNNQRMSDLLETTRNEISQLRNALQADGQAPFTFGTVIAYRPAHAQAEGREIQATTVAGVDILQAGRKLRVSLSPLISPDQLQAGDEVLLNENFTVVAILGAERTGELARVKEVLPDSRLVIISRGEDERVVTLTEAATAAAQREGLHSARVGDAVMVDLRTGTATEIVPLSEVEDVVLEESPDVSYSDIGGLSEQIEAIRDAVELPFLHADLYKEHGLRAPKGILLYGPPGCGKTMIAKAVASSLAETGQSAADDAGQPGTGQGAGSGSAGPGKGAFFLNIKGPELLNKYVGETERHIRVIFSRARERASAGQPVVVFFDEMEALFRTRGSGVSSDVETTIVPQLLAEIDGVESLENVIVIGASNREDMIDPAILRPGRLDVKIRVQRPGREGAGEILGIHLGGAVPLHPELLAAHGDRAAAVAALVDALLDRLFPHTPVARLRLIHADGTHTAFQAADFMSGAVLSNIVDRAKKAAIKDFLRAGTDPAQKGLTLDHLLAAAEEELRDQEDLVNTADPQAWARVVGASTSPVVRIERPSQAAAGAHR
ncbi:proteasome-associated ATPase [Nesterenkonia sandarakina]|uniref:AAA ATPase forming ring-shaped complexes n=1 Tax=Nesterenkonia sandarakina TaxID=272918 RepID=A0A2T0YLM5_9MICC|nr:proteasome ATPase [Nesterenkonia sandarakina]PRZ16184.1 proteasome-associated ATPase [Nesterenkonia sandarakina]